MTPFLIANLHELEPDAKFGSMVLGKRSACARLWQANVPSYLTELVIVGEQLNGREYAAMPARPTFLIQALRSPAPEPCPAFPGHESGSWV